MLEILCQNSDISEFLNQFPKHQWRKCIEASVIVGVRRMKERYPIITYECLLKEAGFQDKKRKDIEQALMHLKSSKIILTSLSERQEII